MAKTPAPPEAPAGGSLTAPVQHQAPPVAHQDSAARHGDASPSHAAPKLLARTAEGWGAKGAFVDATPDDLARAPSGLLVDPTPEQLARRRQ